MQRTFTSSCRRKSAPIRGGKSLIFSFSYHLFMMVGLTRHVVKSVRSNGKKKDVMKISVRFLCRFSLFLFFLFTHHYFTGL